MKKILILGSEGFLGSVLVPHLLKNGNVVIGVDKCFFGRNNVLNKNFTLYKKDYNHLLRVAVNSKMISISLRKRVTPKLKFNLNLINYKRVNPKFKNLKYKLILKHLSKIDNSSSDIGLCFNKKILESGTSNMLFVKENKIYSPLNNIYKGITYKFFSEKVDKIINKEILVNSLKNYDEILLIGSGKGVTSIETINSIKWKRKSLKFYKILFNFYKKEISKCLVYK